MRGLKPILVAACAAIAVGGAPVRADAPTAAKAGLEALSSGDNEAAVRLFTQVLLYGNPTRRDRAFAYEKRAEAFLAMGRDGDALADANRALALDPQDAEAIGVRDKARPVAAIPPPATIPAATADPSDALNAKIKADNDAVAARNKAAFDKYQAEVADYEAKKAAAEAEQRAGEAAYAASLAAHQAQVDALNRQSAAALADWQARVQACKDGNQSQCAH